MATSRPRNMPTILLLLNSTHSTPMRCIASAHPSLATRTNLLTSLRLSGQALSHRFLRLKRASPSFTSFPRTYVCDYCECSCPALLPHLNHYSPGECTPVRGVRCPIRVRAPVPMRRTLRRLLALYRLYRSIYYSLPSLLRQIRLGRTYACSQEAAKLDLNDGVGEARARRHSAVQVLLQK
jgi:hypothetical protein